MEISYKTLSSQQAARRLQQLDHAFQWLKAADNGPQDRDGAIGSFDLSQWYLNDATPEQVCVQGLFTGDAQRGSLNFSTRQYKGAESFPSRSWEITFAPEAVICEHRTCTEKKEQFQREYLSRVDPDESTLLEWQIAH
jgi:hypothetical protein